MCQLCIDALKQYFPDFSDRAGYRLLVNCTSYPFATGEEIAEQLRQLAAFPASTKLPTVLLDPGWLAAALMSYEANEPHIGSVAKARHKAKWLIEQASMNLAMEDE